MTNKKDDIDVKLIKHIQEGLPVTSTPYKDIGQALGMPEEEVIQRLKKLLEEGKIRRLAASIAHRKIGINANAMRVWKVPKERVDEVGKIMAGFEEVTHCYERPTYPDWEYNVFTMIHGLTLSPDPCYSLTRQKPNNRILTAGHPNLDGRSLPERQGSAPRDQGPGSNDGASFEYSHWS